MKKWELGALNIYDYSIPGPLDIYFDFIKNNYKYVDGNIFEFGVFKGKSLLATSLLLKSLGSKKKVIGFDSFSGFPSYNSKDDLDQFKILFDSKRISKKHYEDALKNIEIRSLYLKKESNLNAKNISNSEDFSNCNYQILQSKIKFLELDNSRVWPSITTDSILGYLMAEKGNIKNYRNSIIKSRLDNLVPSKIK